MLGSYGQGNIIIIISNLISRRGGNAEFAGFIHSFILLFVAENHR